jgi:hypothetical protein
MTSWRQFEANRRNALKSMGPRTEAGKQSSRRNAVRHGLTAETVISALEDAEDYHAFEAAITADYDAQSAVERELVLRLASVLWRLRRATTIETGLFELHSGPLAERKQSRDLLLGSQDISLTSFRRITHETVASQSSTLEFAHCFLRLSNLPNFAIDRLSRYEANLCAKLVEFCAHSRWPTGASRRSERGAFGFHAKMESSTNSPLLLVNAIA